MNEEVEVKFTLENPDEVENKLNEIAKFVKAINQKDEYYVPKHEDFFVNVPANKYFGPHSSSTTASTESPHLIFITNASASYLHLKYDKNSGNGKSK